MAIADSDAVAAVLERRVEGLGLKDDEVKRALARELHDRVAQTLTALLIDLENFKAEQFGRASVQTRVDGVQGSMRDVLSNLRDLVQDLRGESGLQADDLRLSLTRLVTDFESRTGIAASLSVQQAWPQRAKPGAAVNLFRIAEEALVNAGRHSGTKRVAVKLSAGRNGELAMTVSDYGRGFDRGVIAPGVGTLGMQERAVLLGARLWIDSYPGYGTSVRVTMPRTSLMVAD